MKQLFNPIDEILIEKYGWAESKFVSKRDVRGGNFRDHIMLGKQIIMLHLCAWMIIVVIVIMPT